MLASIAMLTTTLLFALMVWTREMYMHQLRHVVVELIVMHGFDILTFTFDFIMVCKRWKALLIARFITSSIAFTVGIMAQTTFYNVVMYGEDKITVDFTTSMAKMCGVTIIYIWQTYLVWCVMNLLMYF